LFTVQRKGPQLFLELNMPRRTEKDEELVIRHDAHPSLAIPFSRHIHEHPTNDQSTSHHKDSGWLLAYCKGRRLEADLDVIPVTDIAPTILSFFDVPPQPWMAKDARPAVRFAR